MGRSLSDHMRYHKQGTFICKVCEKNSLQGKKIRIMLTVTKKVEINVVNVVNILVKQAIFQFILDSIRLLLNVLIGIKYFQEKIDYKFIKASVKLLLKRICKI